MKRQRVNNNPYRVCPECGGRRADDKGVLFDSNDANAVCLRCKFRLSRERQQTRHAFFARNVRIRPQVVRHTPPGPNRSEPNS